MEERAVILPPGVRVPEPHERLTGTGMIVNETDLPDHVVQEYVETYIEENASVLGVNQGNQFQNYANEGSLLARQKYRTPGNVIEEITLARDLAERDDDVGAAMGMMAAVAFGDGMANTHANEVTRSVYDEIAKHMDLDELWYELYREWLIAGGFTTMTLFTRQSISFTPVGADRARTRQVVAPRVGIIPAEQIRIVGNDVFRTGTLALKPASATQERFLEELFSPKTSEGRRAELRRLDPVLASLVVQELQVNDPFPGSFNGDLQDMATGLKLYRLNPRMVHRKTMAKGAWAYPRPPLTRNFALLEAKRLLNLMDYALLQGGCNFLVVAKKGTDNAPAQPQEITNLKEVVRRASRTGVIIGDHRLNIEIITPDLSALLDPTKRRLIGSKLANALLRVPEAEEDAGGEGMKARMEMIQRILSADRLLIKRHIERHAYTEVAKRNSQIESPAGVWFPKIILQGAQYFTDLVLKLRDRGDISRHTAVAAGGFDYETEVQMRKLEKPDDRIMTPGDVPFSSPNAGPQDNNQGRPTGSGPGNGRNSPAARPALARPRKVLARNAGETVTARYEEELGSFRIGEITAGILETYPDATKGRLTSLEQSALARIEEDEYGVVHEGPVTVVPVNQSYDIADVQAVRLTPGLSILVGLRDDTAAVARALVFREPEYDELGAQEAVLRWGFEVFEEPDPQPDPEPEE